MKILVVCQHYWPEPFPLEDSCEELVRRGHTVHVVTGVPNYPMGYIYEEYRGGKNRKQEHHGVQITRTFTIGRRHNILFRMLNYFSFAISSTLYTRRLKESYDVVYTCQSSPVMMVNGALSYAKKHGKKTVLYCMDLWPASLAAGGIRESSPIYKVFGWISGKLYKSADRILVTSRMFANYFEEQFGIGRDRIGYLPQYADDRFQVVQKHNSDGVTNLVFAGNVGAAQSLDTALKAAAILKDEPIRWHIVGDGSELEHLKAMAQELKLEQVIFHGRRPLEDMPEFYAMADAMLVTLTADPLISRTLPAKVQTYMAAGKPVIAAADGEIPCVINESQCGFCAKAEDAEGLAQAVREFCKSADQATLGKNARTYYEEHFTRNMFMDKLESELDNACSN